MKTGTFAIAASMVLVLSPAPVVSAANKYWKNSAGSGAWSGGNNWSNVSAAGADNGGVPAAGDIAHMILTDGAARTITYDVTAPPQFIVYVDLTGAGTNRTTFSMSGNTLTTQALGVGYTGRATFNHSGGSVNVNGPGLDMAVGEHAGANGIYNLSGTGALSVAHDQFVGRYAGSTGAFNQTGGSNTVANQLVIGTDASSVGSYTLSGGSLTAVNNLVVGNSGTGTLNIQGGGSAYTGELSINSASAVNLNGGSLRFSSVSGAGGVSKINYTAGKIQLPGQKVFGQNSEIAALFGATIPAGKSLVIEDGTGSTYDVTIATNFVVAGGSLISTDNLGLSHPPAGSSYSLTINDGLVYVESYFTINNTKNVINLNGGTFRFNSYLYLPGFSGTFNFNAGTIQLGGNRTIGSDADILEILGAAPTLPAGKGLTVEGAATISTGLTLNGGTFRASSLLVNGSLHFGGGLLELTGGSITGLAHLTVPSGGEFRASGVQALRVTGAAGSTITATGNLTLGNASAVNGFGTQGTLQVGANIVTLLDANDVVFDSLALATLGDFGGPGTLSAANGLTIDFGGNITGFGAVSTTNNAAKPLINNGHITGASAAERITLPGYVKGVGTFDNVNITGTFSPGLSPTSITVGNLALSPTSTLIMELGGTTPGSQYDQINALGELTLGGTLEISLINGFTPAVGQTFDLMNAGILTGAFSSVLLPTLPGLAWDASQLATGVLSVVPGFAADFDEDGDVDGNDLARWRRGFAEPATHMQGDSDGDADADGADFLAWQRQFGRGPAATAASPAVPEPTTRMLLLLAINLLVCRRLCSTRRRQESHHVSSHA